MVRRVIDTYSVTNQWQYGALFNVIEFLSTIFHFSVKSIMEVNGF